MINDQALLHLLGRLEHENVTLKDALAKSQERVKELEAEGADRVTQDRG
jgi:hypothetical protein